MAKGLFDNRGDHGIFLLIDGTYSESAFEIKKAFRSILPEKFFIYW